MLVHLLLAGFLFGSGGVPATLPSCDLATLQALGYCPTDTNNGTEIVIDGSQETEGEPGFPPVGDFDDEWYPPAEIGTPHKPFDFDQCLLDWDSYRRCFRALEDSEPAEETEEEAEAAIPAITINDLARFAPEGSVVTGEPDNVGVAGLPTNFVTAASAQTVDAELFGFPISVRFTPSAYDFTYGDGDSATTSTGGSTWAALGQAQFTPTDTGHTYRERGTYFAQVDVRYTAEVDFGVGWYPISGEVTTTGAPQQVRIFEAHTALVAFTCAEAPNSPGC